MHFHKGFKIQLSILGGVFIATLVGLGIAMIVLAFEVYFHKKKENSITDSTTDEKLFQARGDMGNYPRPIQVGTKTIKTFHM